MPRSHTVSIELPCAPEAAFRLLHTPSAIRAWWHAARAIVLPEAGGVWIAAWGEDEDDPDYVSAARIDAFLPPHRLRLSEFRYLARTGALPFDATAMATEFRVEATPGGCRLTIQQSGFPDEAVADDFYAACEQGWKVTCASLVDHVSRGAPA